MATRMAVETRLFPAFPVADGFDEMEAPDFESEAVIEAVRRMVGGVAVEHDDLAIPLAGDGFEMPDEQAADAGGALLGSTTRLSISR